MGEKVGPTWLDVVKIKFENELGSLDPNNLHEPNGQVKINDHVVGEIADADLKRLLNLIMVLEKSANQNLLEAHYAKNKLDQDLFFYNATELVNKADFLSEIFWASIKDSFDLWRKPQVAIRRDWKVVWQESDD